MRIHVRAVPGWLSMLSGRGGIGSTPQPIRFVPHPARIKQRQPQRGHRRRAPPQTHHHPAENVEAKVG